jgi:hypothetical protein
MYIRFQNIHGDGVFSFARDFSRNMTARGVSRADQRRFDEAYDFIYHHTVPPPESAYSDRFSRYPRTWYKESARQHVHYSRVVAHIMTLHGTTVWVRYARTLPGRLLWEDRVQIVVRPPREFRADPKSVEEVVASWSGDRTTIRRANLRSLFGR